MNCQVFIQFSCRGSKNERNVCVLTNYKEDHNHVNTTAMFYQDTHKIEEYEEINSVIKALKLRVKAAPLRDHLRQEYNKPGISKNHVKNLMAKMKSPEVDAEELSSFLKEIRDEGGDVQIMKDNDRKVRVMTVLTAQMKKAYQAVDPTVVMVDTTFNYC